MSSLFRSPDGFPGQTARAFARKVVKIVNAHTRFVFEGVPAGEFAVALIHDENANSKLDTNLFGIPSEGWGTSRDAKANAGPPEYADARMSLAPGEHKRITVRVQY